ncbi:NADH dehydrogenase [ubiquinone] 1 alpha subcomplex subunit 11-like [Musca vetustissima]|uniref:NADH dehydrogenase [ubiquinone] 1 alpha subcomplex subunit 11-like n=2 Tax=Musca vetustissima TaxID=27455 RepID=UPI002AB7B0BC|nr:NADH dehydrogenase [ubiquinone] 1 alpha subcomplex subunit 11-like [Musca vetustissima]
MALSKTGYYDKPEGQDLFGKMVATNTYAATAGLAWSTVDVLMLTHPKGYLPTLARFAYNTGPMMGMASAFTLATYLSTNVRGKDDRLNYFIGGFAAGGVFGAWRRSHVAGLVMGLFFGIAGVIKKTSIQEGWEFFPPLNHHAYMGVRQIDNSLMADPTKEKKN